MSAHLRNLIIQYAKSLPNWQKILAKRSFCLEENHLADKEFINLALQRFKYDLKINGVEEIGLDILSEINSLQDSDNDNNETFSTRLTEISEIAGVNEKRAKISNQFYEKLRYKISVGLC